MMSEQERETAVRILGAADGYAHALLAVQQQISNLLSVPIAEHHRRKLAARDQQLRPLVRLRDKFQRDHQECREAYRRRMSGHVQ